MPGIDNLYTALKQDGLYTKSLEEFKNQFSTPESIQKLHTALRQDNLYTKPLADFQNQFFGDILKKKEEGLPLQPLADGGLLGTSAMAQDQQLASSGEGQLYDLGPIYQQYQQQQAQQPKAQEYISFEEEAPKTGLFGEAAPVAPEPISLSKAELTEFMPFVTDEQIIRGYLPENYEQLSPSEKVKAAAELTKIPELIPIFEKKASEMAAEEPGVMSNIGDIIAGASKELTGNFLNAGVASLQYFLDDKYKDKLLEIEDPEARWVYAKSALLASESLPTPLRSIARSLVPQSSFAEDLSRSGAAQQAKVLDEYDKGVTQYLIDGDYGNAGALAFYQAMASAPTLLSAMAGPAGIASLGLSSFSGFTKEDVERGDNLDLSDFFNNVTKAGAEAFFEQYTGKLGRRAFSSIVGNKVASGQAASSIVKEILKGFGLGVAEEGGSEAATAAVQLLSDAIFAGREVPMVEAMKQISDAFIVGGLMGGPLSGTGAGFEAARKKAAIEIAPKSDKDQLQKNIADKIELEDAKAKTSNPEVVSTIDGLISEIDKKTVEIEQRLKQTVDFMTEEELIEITQLKKDIDALAIKATQVNEDPNISESQRRTTLALLKQQAESAIQKRQTIIDNAVQKQTTSEVPVQPEARVGEEMAEGKPETKPEVVTEEGKVEEVTPEFYVQELDRTKASDPTLYWSVDPVALETAKGGTIVSVDGGYGFVSPEGDIKGVFKTPETTRKGVADDVLKEAVKNGGIKLDNFDNYLSKIYKRNGFRVVSRIPFDEEYAPVGWDESQGKPDVVAMVYDPNNQLDIEEKTFDNYDKAMAYRDSFVEQARSLQEAPAVEQITETSTPSEVKQSIDAASTALGVAFPEVEFIVGDNLQDTKARIVEALTPRYGAERAQTVADGFTNVRGQALFAGAKPIAIVINKTQANNRTAGHEAWEVMLNDAFGQNPEKFAEFRKAIDAQLKVSGYEDVAEALTKFSNEYADQGTEAMFREYMAEFGGMLVEGGLDPKNLTQQEKTLLEKIKDIINKFALELTGKEVFLKDATPENIIDFMVTISEKVSKGETVEQFFVEPTRTDEFGNLPKPSARSQKVLKDKNKDIEKSAKDSVIPGRTASTRVSADSNIHSVSDKIVGVDAMIEAAKVNKRADEHLIKIASELSLYPLVQKPTKVTDTKSAIKAITEFKQAVKENLKWLYDQFGEEVRAISKLWYDGANKISNDIAKNNDLTIEQVSGVMAVLSPQKDWFMNLSLGERVIDVYKTKQDYVIDDKMKDYMINAKSGVGSKAKPLFNPKITNGDISKLVDLMSNKKFKELDTVLQSYFVRAYDEVYNSKDYNNITPDGKVNGFVKKANGENGKVAWGDFGTIAKALSILKDGNIENISQNIGDMHKVRNFYNNIVNPNDPNAVTIDTHAVAAALLKPLSGSANEVTYNFSGPSSVLTGTKGSYAVYADAYRELANELGLLPREVQSITWEAVRGLFKPQFKAKQKNVDFVADVWEQYKNGKITKEKVYETISNQAGGISTPVWYDYMATGSIESLEANSAATDQAELSKIDEQQRPIDTATGVEVKLTTEEIQTLNDNFGIQDGEVELRARSQKINPSEVKAISSSLNNLDNNELESLKDLIHKDVKAPNKTQKAYKLFKVKKGFPGELFPLFVGANESVTTGDWIAAKAGELTTTKEGKTMVKSTLGPLAYRPGWHSGEFAIATHIGAKKNPSDKAPTLRDSDQVWAEVEVGDDFDWQTEANNRAEKTKDGKIIPRTAHITDQLPALGNYKYKTNSNMTGSWIISGEMKVNRVLTDEEVAKINEKSGSNDLPRVSPFDFDAYGFNQDGTPKNKKQVLSNQVARAYIIAKETGENPNLVSAVESATTITARSQKINYKDLPGYDRMRKEIDGIIEKATKRGATKARILEDVLGYIRTSKVYEIANDSQREQMERDIKKEFGERIKSAPKVDRLFGVIKDAKNITVDEMTVLKEKIKAEAKASRDAIAFINGIRSRISSEITAMEKSGVISARQVQAIINRLNKVNLTNPQAVNSFVDYMQKVFKNAEYAEKLSKSNDLAKRIKKLTKSDNIAAGTKAVAKQFSKIEPRRVENIDEYLENASALYEAMRPTMVKVTGGGVDARFKKAIDYDKLQDYSNRELDKQEKQKVDELLARNKDLVMAGILTEDMNLDEIKKLLDAIKEDDEATLPSEEKQKMIRDAVKKVFGYYRSIALSMIQRGVDPFTGDVIELTDSQKRVARRFLEINTDLLSLRDSYTAVESLENFIVNKSTDGMAATIADYLGVTNAQNLVKEGYKGKALRLFYSKKAGRAWAEQIEQLDLMVQRMFGGVNRALSFMRASGANEFKVGKTSAQVELNKILNKYANKFGKTDGFNSLENVMERGVLAFLSRTVNENTTRQQNEFERRKKLVEETLNYMKSGTEKEQKQAVELQKVYDKIVKGSSTLDQVKSKASKTNKDAVDFWISEWSDRYDNLQELSRNVYNVVLGSDIDYTPDRFRRVSGQDIAEAQWGESMFANNSDYFDTKEAGVLMENKRVKTLGDRPSRIVSFDFDVNMSNSMYDALIDINTAEATRQMKSFFESPSFDKIMASKDDSDVVKDRMKQYVIRSKRKDYVTQDQLSGLFKGLNIVAGLGAGRALGGILQVPKQTIGVAFNTMINSGGRLSWIDAMNSKEFIDNSGYAIALRGVASNADVQSINKILEKASQSTGESALRLINKANELWLETFLVKPDVWIARTSWISYYKQRLQKMGYDTSGIEWSSHKLNKEAADYAQAMVDRQQNYSDSDLAGDFFASKDPLKMFLRKTFFPFMTFVMNQKSRMYVDLSIIGNPTSSTEEKFNAAKSLSGMSIEMAVYAGMSMFFSNMLRELTDYLWGDEEDEEEKNKRMKRSAQYYAKNIAMDIFSPIPATNEPVRIAFNAMLEKIGVDKDEFELPKDFTQKGALGLLGMNAIAAEKLIAAYEKIEMASSGKYTKEDFFGNEVQMQLDEETQKKMAYVAVADFMYAMGFLPTEAGTIANNATKKAKKMGKRIKEKDAESPSGGVIQAKVKKAEITKGE